MASLTSRTRDPYAVGTVALFALAIVAVVISLITRNQFVPGYSMAIALALLFALSLWGWSTITTSTVTVDETGIRRAGWGSYGFTLRWDQIASTRVEPVGKTPFLVIDAVTPPPLGYPGRYPLFIRRTGIPGRAYVAPLDPALAGQFTDLVRPPIG